MTHRGTVTLETERLVLRRFTVSDDAAMFDNWAGDPEVTKYLTWPTHTSVDVSRQVLSDWVANYEKPDYYSWAIVPKAVGAPIGSIAVVAQRAEIGMVEIGYCIGRTWWRQGYTTEALTRLVRFFFEDAGANRVEARHDPRNPNSGGVMRKAGLKYEGTSRQAGKNNQGICDNARYAIIAEDYFGKTTPP